MRQALLKTITASDVKEILEVAGELLDTFGPPVTPEEILQSLIKKNGNPLPSIIDRFPKVLSAAEQAVGRKLSREKCKENTLVRSFVSYILRAEGYSYSDIGRMLRRDHSSVIHLYRKACDMLSVPMAYREEINMFREFEELLAQQRQCSHPSSQTTSASALAESPAR